MTIFSGV